MRRSFVRRSALALVLALASSACAESQTQDTSIGGRTPFPTANAPGTWQPPTAAQDVTAFVRPLVSSWRPKGTTVVTMAADKLIATSLDGGSSTELVELVHGAEWEWSMRHDGGAFVAAVEMASGITRVAIWEPAAGVVRWLTADGPFFQFSPVWSHDGQAIYFGGRCDQPGVSRVRADGTGLQQVLNTRCPPITTPVAEMAPGRAPRAATRCAGPGRPTCWLIAKLASANRSDSVRRADGGSHRPSWRLDRGRGGRLGSDRHAHCGRHPAEAHPRVSGPRDDGRARWRTSADQRD